MLQKVTEAHGYNYFCFGLFNPVPSPKALFNRNTPSAWNHYYAQNQLLEIDPIVDLSYRQSRPIYWDQLRFLYQLKPLQLKFLHAAREAGLYEGLSIPLHGPCHYHAILSLFLNSQSRSDSQSSSLASLLLCANHLFDKACELYGSRYFKILNKDLSERECECLRWASEGKTSWEIAKILGISERTVNYHLTQSASKTDSSNRYQAIARAVYAGLLHPPARPLSMESYQTKHNPESPGPCFLYQGPHKICLLALLLI
ncbi:helix-turn-helix transcriptional regulator [Dongshaea marina]|uniref:helix-turn-helix transcriptional regulator n=1 Tax=Dongshaea marina TaxID=2047966 RepID=UPI00131F0A2E|nr:LuxR family transcriptional regulator [Dongshaea marina]